MNFCVFFFFFFFFSHLFIYLGGFFVDRVYVHVHFYDILLFYAGQWLHHSLCLFFFFLCTVVGRYSFSFRNHRINHPSKPTRKKGGLVGYGRIYESRTFGFIVIVCIPMSRGGYKKKERTECIYLNKKKKKKSQKSYSIPAIKQFYSEFHVHSYPFSFRLFLSLYFVYACSEMMLHVSCTKSKGQKREREGKKGCTPQDFMKMICEFLTILN